MADLIVKPAYVMGPTDILTVDKFNLMATPIVELSISDRVDDQSFFRNGNFYSSFWTTPAGMNCPIGVETSNANYWTVNPTGAAITCLRSTNVPDINSLFSMLLGGAAGATDCRVSQIINADLSSTMRRTVTFSGYIYNGAGLGVSPKLETWTCTTFNNFNTLTLVQTSDLQTCADSLWTFVSVTFDLSTVTNVANGMRMSILLPSGALSATTKSVAFSRIKIQIGEISTEFTDDVGLFVQTPSVDSTMLQDGCIARPSLFLPNVVPSGAFQAKAIANGDVGDSAIDARCLATGAITGGLGYVPINKAGDTAIGPAPLVFSNEVTVGAPAYQSAAVVVQGTTANNANDSYMPSISFSRQGSNARAIGLDVNNRFKTVDQTGVVGWLLDTITGVPTSAIQNGAVTIPKLGSDVIAMMAAPGLIQMFGGPSPPGGWLVCDGSEISRTGIYAALFSAIGTYWGVGNNSSTFNIPDLRGRSPLGFVNSGGSGLSGRGFASRGGEENHTLAIGEIPNHNHTLHDTGHAHSYTVSATGIQQAQAGGGVWANVQQAATTGASGAGVSIDPVGGNGTHNNMHPFSVLYFIIKY